VFRENITVRTNVVCKPAVTKFFDRVKILGSCMNDETKFFKEI